MTHTCAILDLVPRWLYILGEFGIGAWLISYGIIRGRYRDLWVAFFGSVIVVHATLWFLAV